MFQMISVGVLLNTNWNHLKFPFEMAYCFAVKLSDTIVCLMKPLGPSQLKKEFWSLHCSRPSRDFYGRVMSVQVQCSFLVKTPESHWHLEDNDLRRNWGDLQTKYRQRRYIYLQTGKFSVPFYQMSSWKFFVSMECTKLSMLILAVFRDHFHMFTLPGDFMKHGVNGDDFYFIKQQRKSRLGPFSFLVLIYVF